MAVEKTVKKRINAILKTKHLFLCISTCSTQIWECLVVSIISSHVINGKKKETGAKACKNWENLGKSEVSVLKKVVFKKECDT